MEPLQIEIEEVEFCGELYEKNIRENDFSSKDEIDNREAGEE